MARLVGNLSGRIHPAATLGIDQGPTGQYGWGSDGGGTIVPQWVFKNQGTFDSPISSDNQSFLGILSLWVYTEATFNDSDGMFKCSDNVGVGTWSTFGLSNGQPRLRLRNNGQIAVVNVEPSVAIPLQQWNHLLMSWDISPGSVYADTFHMYLNDVDIRPATPTVYTIGQQVNWDVRIGIGDTQLPVPSIAMGAFYLNPDAYLDFSIESNRRLFRDADGIPTALGIDGSRPTDAQPPVYIDNPAAALTENRGYIGDFAFTTGTATIIDFAGPNP